MAQLATAAIPLPFTDFSGGINTRDQPYLLDQSQARDLSNLQGTAAGALVKRAGCQTLATTPAALTSLFALESITPSYLVGAGGTALYSVSAGGTVTPIKTGVTNNASWEFVSAPAVSSQGPLYGMNGTDTPQQWSGSGSTGAWTATDTGGTVPNGKYCIYAQNQVFVTGVAANPSRVYWSGIADPTAWNPANLNGSGFMDLDPADGEATTGIGTVGPYILVGKPSKLWVITNVATASARKVGSNVGVTSHRSIVETRDGTYFFGGDNVYVTNGSTVKTISALIIPTLGAIQPGQYSQICGAYFNSHYYLSIPLTGLTNDTTLDFDAQLNSWWKHTFASNQFATWTQAGEPYLYSAKSTAPIVEQCFTKGVWQDNGSPFTWTYRGPWSSPVFYRHKWYQTPYYKKRFRQIRIDGYGTVDISTAMNFVGLETLRKANIFSQTGGGVFGAADGTVFGAADGTVFGSAFLQRARFHSFGAGYAISIVLSATSTTPDLVTSFILMVVGRRDQVVS